MAENKTAYKNCKKNFKQNNTAPLYFVWSDMFDLLERVIMK